MRHDAADGELVDGADRAGGKIARDALVDGGGIEVAVAQHDSAARQGGGDDLAHDLGAGGGEEQELGLGAHFVAAGVVDDNVADLFADLGAARLTGGDNLAADFLQVLGEAGELGGFAAAFGPLEGDEFAGRLGLGGHD